MKRRRIGKATAAGIVAGVMAVFGAGCNDNATVYGPPEMLDPSLNMNDEVYGPPEMLDSSYDGGEDGSMDVAEDPDATDEWAALRFDPAAGGNAVVYGPPEMYGLDAEPTGEPADTAKFARVTPEAATLDAASNMNQVAYGPPPMPGAESAGFPFFASGAGAHEADVGTEAEFDDGGDAISSFWD